MKALLDTNIIIHRETAHPISDDIGILFRWLEYCHYTKCVHSATLEEINRCPNKETVKDFQIKLGNYETLEHPSPVHNDVLFVSSSIDATENDIVDTQLLNEVYVERVDILVTEDKKIHRKANLLGIANKVFTIESFLEKAFSEHPEKVNYKVLSVQKRPFANINLSDSFFDSLKEDYYGFDKWFLRKYDEEAYVSFDSSTGRVLSFLYIKEEGKEENYGSINPPLPPKKRLKIGTFKVIQNGLRLGERFLKIIFDNALRFNVEEIYVTIFDKRDSQRRLIDLLENWGFYYWGTKGEEKVYVRDFSKVCKKESLQLSYPYVCLNNSNIFLTSIKPEYHTELFPDSILNTESPSDFIEGNPHRNCISKTFLSRAYTSIPKAGDVLIFYRTGGVHKSVVTTIGVVKEVKNDFMDEIDFVTYCRRGSVFEDSSLREWWNQSPTNRPFAVRFLYIYSFPKRINMARLIELGILQGVKDAPRGFRQISVEQLRIILKDTQSDESFIVN